MASALIAVGLVLTPALLLLLYRRLGALPLAVSAAVQRSSSTRDREDRALDAMAEAVAAKSGRAVMAIHAYQEQMVDSLRAQVADAEVRARAAERRAADATRALGAAADLVRELHGALDTALGLARELRELQLTAAITMGPEATTGDAEADDGERRTTEVHGPAPQGAAPTATDRPSFDDSDETMVAGRPATLPAPPPGGDGGRPPGPVGDVVPAVPQARRRKASARL